MPSNTRDIALCFETVSFAYQNETRTPVLNAISFAVGRREIFGLVGPSGCGKSTILKIAADLVDSPYDGKVEVCNLMPTQARCQQHVGILFQRPVFLPWRNVIENILLPIDIAKTGDSASIKRAADLLDLAGMADFRLSQIHELSGGMKQRVSLIRSLMTSPDLLLLDEPFVSLDEILKEEFLELIQRVASTLALTIVHVTHSLEDAVALCDRIAVLAPRPTTVTSVVNVPLPRPRGFSQRVQPPFLNALSSIREALRLPCPTDTSNNVQ